MPDRIYFGVRDYSDEYGQLTFEIADQGGATTVADIDTVLLAGLRSAVDDVTLGNIARESVTILSGGNDANPGNVLAQRELGIRVFMQNDVSQDKFNVTIPCADLASLTIEQGGDIVTLADGGPMAALVTAIETHARKDGETVTVTKALVVGRNS